MNIGYTDVTLFFFEKKIAENFSDVLTYTILAE